MSQKGKDAKAPQEEEYEFQVPDFDEDAFIHKELTGFQTSIAVLVLGGLAALSTMFVARATDGGYIAWPLGVATVAVLIVAIKPLLGLAKIDTKSWGRREVLGSGFMLFFSWLALAIILLNPPITDLVGPEVLAEPATQYQFPDQPFLLYGAAADDDAVIRLEATVRGPNGPVDLEFAGDTRLIEATANLPIGEYVLNVTAEDPAGHVTSVENTFRVTRNAMQVTTPQESDEVQLTSNVDEIKVELLEPRDRIAYVAAVDALGNPVVFFEYDEALGLYKVSKNFRGWDEGLQRIEIVAQVQNQFLGATILPGGEIRSGPYNVTVEGVGEYQPTVRGLLETNPAFRQTPGLGVVAVAGAIVAAAMVARRKSE